MKKAKKPLPVNNLDGTKKGYTITPKAPPVEDVVLAVRNLLAPHFKPGTPYNGSIIKDKMVQRGIRRVHNVLDEPASHFYHEWLADIMSQDYSHSGAVISLEDLSYAIGHVYYLNEYGDVKKNIQYAYAIALKGLSKQEAEDTKARFLKDTDRIQKEGLCLRLREAMGRAEVRDFTQAARNPLDLAAIITQYRRDSIDSRTVPDKPVVFDGIDFTAARYLWMGLHKWWIRYPEVILNSEYSLTTGTQLYFLLQDPQMDELVLWDTELAEDAWFPLPEQEPKDGDTTRVTKALSQLPDYRTQAHYLTDIVPNHPSRTKTTPCSLLGFAFKKTTDPKGRPCFLAARLMAQQNEGISDGKLTVEQRAPMIEVLGWAIEGQPVPKTLEPAIRLLEFMTREVVEYVPEPTSLVPLVYPKGEAPPKERSGRLGHYSTILLRRVRLEVQSTGQAPIAPDSGKDGTSGGWTRDERSDVVGHYRTVRYGPGRCYSKQVWIDAHESPANPDLPKREKPADRPVRRIRVKR